MAVLASLRPSTQGGHRDTARAPRIQRGPFSAHRASLHCLERPSTVFRAFANILSGVAASAAALTAAGWAALRLSFRGNVGVCRGFRPVLFCRGREKDRALLYARCVRCFDWSNGTLVTGGEDARLCLWTRANAQHAPTVAASGARKVHAASWAVRT
eukprot:6191045-Pleurochrysis_carterae.AAC.1